MDASIGEVEGVGVEGRDDRDSRAGLVIDAVDARPEYLDVSHKLRHTFCHRARARPLRVRNGQTGRDEARVWLAGDTLDATVGAVQALGHDLAQWGIELVAIPGPEGGAQERGWLDVALFAPRIICHAGWLADQVLKAVDPANDERIVMPPGSGGVPSEPYFRPEGGRFAIDFTALAGLVDGLESPTAPLQPCPAIVAP